MCSSGHRAVLFAPLLAASLAGACATSVAPQADLAALLADSTLVDLTHTFDETTIVWPTSNPFRLEKVADGVTPGGYYYAANNVHTAEHGGTHLDAPVHFAAGQQTAEAVPLSRLVGPAVVIDVTARAEADADALITTADLQAWEAAHGAIDRGSLVLLRTGFSTRWPDAAGYLGTAARGEEGVAQLHFPGLQPEAATWLVEERGVGAVGIDTASIDRGQSTSFDAHRVLAAANVPAFENLAHLDQVPVRGAFVFALPMKVGGGSGAPLRAIAVVPRTTARR